MRLLWKLLKTNISIPQFAGFFIANLIGMTIVLTGIQFADDIKPFFTQGDSFMKNDYAVISKKIKVWDSFSKKGTGFSEKELKKISEQRYVERIGAFTPANFQIMGGFEMKEANLFFRTYLFFESVPDSFLDVSLNEWKFSPDSTVIPIILPRAYLNLYNFGFAESRSLPKLSEGVIQLLHLDINIKGNEMQQQFSGKIYGFSDRLNTILVPQTFMDWANQNFGNREGNNPARVIVELNNPSDETFVSFLQDNNYETEGDKEKNGRIASFMRTVTGSVMSIGTLICLLSFFILILSIYLLLQKSAKKLHTLFLIGYSVNKVSSIYQSFALALNLLACTGAIISVAFIREKYMPFLRELMPNVTIQNLSSTIFIAILLFMIISLCDMIIIFRKVRNM